MNRKFAWKGSNWISVEFSYTSLYVELEWTWCYLWMMLKLVLVMMYVGTHCVLYSCVAAPVARTIKFWSTPLLTTGAMTFDFSKDKRADTSEYHLLVRVGLLSFRDMGDFLNALFAKYVFKINWLHIVSIILWQHEVYKTFGQWDSVWSSVVFHCCPVEDPVQSRHLGAYLPLRRVTTEESKN